MKIIVTILIVTVGFLITARPTFASLNTHSIDLEESSTQYLSKTDEVALSLTGSWTVEAWINLESQPAVDTDHGVIEKGDATATGEYDLRVIARAGPIQSVSCRIRGGAESVADTWSAPTAEWHHIACSYNSADGVTIIYLDGVNLEQATLTSGGSSDTTKDVHIGFEQVNAAYFDGLIDEVRIWNDVRTAAEISDNYQTELVGNEQGLVAYYQLDNNMNDSGPNAFTLTNNNSAAHSTNVPFAGTADAAATTTRRRFITLF